MGLAQGEREVVQFLGFFNILQLSKMSFDSVEARLVIRIQAIAFYKANETMLSS